MFKAPGSKDLHICRGGTQTGSRSGWIAPQQQFKVQRVWLARLDETLSTPELLRLFTTKYQVPGARPVTR